MDSFDPSLPHVFGRDDDDDDDDGDDDDDAGGCCCRRRRRHYCCGGGGGDDGGGGGGAGAGYDDGGVDGGTSLPAEPVSDSATAFCCPCCLNLSFHEGCCESRRTWTTVEDGLGKTEKTGG